MKINGSQIGKGLQGIDAAKNRGADKTSDAKSSGASGLEGLVGSSKVNVSERAQMMQKAKEIATAAPDVNEARVAELQKLIDSGKYSVDAEAVADRLVDSHLMFPE